VAPAGASVQLHARAASITIATGAAERRGGGRRGRARRYRPRGRAVPPGRVGRPPLSPLTPL